MKLRNWILSATLPALALGGVFWWWQQREKAPTFRLAAVEKGDLRRVVTATGTINPRLVVQVGTQVSGTIAKVLVDYNSHVKKGQLLAKIDTTFLRAAVEEAEAGYTRTHTQVNLAEKQAARSKQLFDKGLASQADWEQAQADFAVAKANAVSSRAALDRARINMRYASITAPIDGVVIAKQVDAGQTVAASFNTPTLFTLADALDSMEVQANVDEADIGQVWKGQSAGFSVDAYPGRDFAAQVVEVRLQPTTVQNVVQYTVILRVRNGDGKLLPGMTANVTLLVQERKDVLKVPSAALAFTPVRPKGNKGGRRPADSSTLAGEKGAPGDSGERRWKRRQGGTSDSTGRVFLLVAGKPKRIPVKLGLSDGGYTEVTGEIAAGDSVIVGSTGAGANANSGSARGLTSPGPSPQAGGMQGLRRL